jgi:Fe-S oxidoreductase
VRFRKQIEIEKAANELRKGEFAGDVKVLTSCPSCLQGLTRFDADSGTTADYIVVEMAEKLLGKEWMKDYVTKANQGGIERVLV